MIKRLTRTMLIAGIMVGLCQGILSSGRLNADEPNEIPEPMTIDGCETDGYISDYSDMSDISGLDAAAGPGGGCLSRIGACMARCHAYDMSCRPWEYGYPDLFYNFYMPNNCGGVPAQLYIAPRPVPPLVGHTYYTYQPFLPHEFTYPHYRTYRRYYDEGRGMTRAKAVWYCEPVSTTLKGVRNAIRLPR
jgi:hypothetical protein